jgi:putative ATP-binding cassette transporter
MRLFKHPLWKQFTNIAWPFFASESRTKAIGGIIILAVLLLAVNGMNLINSYVMRGFMTALEQRQPSRFYLFGLALAAVFGLATIGEAFQFFTEQRTGLLWRGWLTRHLLDRYLAHRAYHRLSVNQSIDNPDQRISEDIKTFTTSSLSFFVLLLNSALTQALFLGVLWSITPWLVLTAVLYSAAGSLGTIVLGRRLVPLNNYQLQKEADFRFALGRVREHGELGGTKSRLLDRFEAVVENFQAIVRVTRNVGFFTREYNYLIQILPAVVVAPLYMYHGADFGVVAQAAMAFGQVVGAFSLIVTKYQEMSTFAAVVNRLGSMWEATASAPAPAADAETPVPSEKESPQAGREGSQREQHPPRIERQEDARRVAYEKLTLWTPQDKRLLIRELSLEVPEGKRLLVSGPDGSGKTALGLATAGLWGAGEGTVICPKIGDIMFLPQRLYTATGCLRDLLLYGVSQDEVDDEQLRAALRDVGLGVLAEQTGGLDSQWDWSNDLSTGDRRALALARLLLAKPRFALLDGVPWQFAPARLEHLYEALARSPITYISLGGPADLKSYHDLWLELHGDGKWQLRQTNNLDGEHSRSQENGRPESERVVVGSENQR